MPIPFKLDYVIEQLNPAQALNERRVLKQMTGFKLSSDEAQRAWPQVQEHKWYLSERLGRDVGLRVAAVDYFENIQPINISHKTRAHRGTLPPRLPMMLPLFK